MEKVTEIGLTQLNPKPEAEKLAVLDFKTLSSSFLAFRKSRPLRFTPLPVRTRYPKSNTKNPGNNIFNKNPAQL